MSRLLKHSEDPNEVLNYISTQPLDSKRFRNKADCLVGHGIRLFHRNGVNGTGLNELLEAAQMGKSQFYHYFNNKEDFVCEVVRREMDIFLRRIAPSCRTLKCLDDFDSWFEPYLALARLPGNLGCPVGAIASEMSPSSEKVRLAASESLQRWINAIAEGLMTWQAHESLRGDFCPQRTAQYLASTIQGALLMCRSFRSLDPILQVREQLKVYLGGFLAG